MKYIITITLLIGLQLTILGQVKTEFHPELFSTKTIKKAHQLDNKHPNNFFDATTKELKENLNDAALLFYIGQFRYRYYISCLSDDKAKKEIQVYYYSQEIIGSEINYKLGENIDNYIKILDAVVSWVENNDSKFCSKKNNPESYDEILLGLKELKQTVIENKGELERK